MWGRLWITYKMDTVSLINQFGTNDPIKFYIKRMI